eukprot:6696529-Prorocentrum_lima.AAC.1
MPAVLVGARLIGRDSKAKAERMPGTASLMCRSNMEAAGELAIHTKSSMYSMRGWKEREAVWWSEGKKG